MQFLLTASVWSVRISVLLKSKHQFGHHENQLFVASKYIFNGTKYPKKVQFNFKNKITGLHPYKCIVNVFPGGFDPENVVCSKEITNVPGELTDVLANMLTF